MTRILITGCSGLLGRYLLRTADPSLMIYSERFDILNPSACAAVFQAFRPEVVIHCAGESRVDFAEQNKIKAWEKNLTGTDNLLICLAESNSHFVYISSNAVYYGDTPPYSEEDECLPVNEYGRTKLAAERLVHGYKHRSTIIRPIFLYGFIKEGGRKNMDVRVKESLAKGERIKAAADVVTQPTYAEDCANAIWKIVDRQKNHKDIFNVGSKERMSLFKFAGEVARAFELDASLIDEAKAQDFQTFAPRPRDTSFRLDKLDEMGITCRPPCEGLTAMRSENG